MGDSLLINTLPGALVIGVGAYAWYRSGFRTPSLLRLSLQTSRRLLAAFGWLILVGISIRSVGGFFGDGRVQIAQNGHMYAYRSREPLLFWGEIAGEMLLIGGLGALLVNLARRRLAPSVNDA
jgi:hypothetical protein